MCGNVYFIVLRHSKLSAGRFGHGIRDLRFLSCNGGEVCQGAMKICHMRYSFHEAISENKASFEK